MTTFERVAVELGRDKKCLLQNETSGKGEGHPVRVQIVSASEGDQSRR